MKESHEEIKLEKLPIRADRERQFREHEAQALRDFEDKDIVPISQN